MPDHTAIARCAHHVHHVGVVDCTREMPAFNRNLAESSGGWSDSER